MKRDWYSRKRFAELKGVHVNTVTNWISRGFLDADRIGPSGHWRIYGVRDCAIFVINGVASQPKPSVN